MTIHQKHFCHHAIISVVLVFSVQLESCRSRLTVKPTTLSAADAKINPDSPFEFFTPSAWIPYATDQLMSQPLRGGFELFQLNMMDFGQFTGGFRASIEQQQDGVVLRSERWRMGVDVGPGALIQTAANSLTPVAIRITGGREITFTRTFSSHREAFSAKPVVFSDVPLDAKRALSMNAGDFVSIPANMGLTLGLEPLSAARPFAVSAGVGAFWSGEFRINIYSQGNGFVRVKVSPSTAMGLGAHAGLGARLNMFGYSPGRLINYDRQAERFFGLDFLSWSKTRVIAGERYVFDYMFNLNDTSAQVAYDAIMSRTLRIKSSFQSLNILRSQVKADLVVADLTPAEYLAQLDQNLVATERRVARVFSGSEFYQSDSSAGRFGTRVFQINGNRSLTTSKMRVNTERDLDGSASYLTALMMQSSRGQSSWFSPLRENQSLRATALFGSDPAFNQHILRDLRFEVSYSQNDLMERELRAIRASQMVLFGGYFEQLGLNSSKALAGNQTQFQSVGRFAVNPNMIEALRMQITRNPIQSQAIVQNIVHNVIERLRQNRGSMEWLRDVSEALARGELRNLDSELGTPIINLTMDLGRRSTAEYLGELFKLMARSAASELIVGGFICDTALALQSTAAVSIEESASNAQPYVNILGSDGPSPEMETLGRSTYAFTHMGYEN